MGISARTVPIGDSLFHLIPQLVNNSNACSVGSVPTARVCFSGEGELRKKKKPPLSLADCNFGFPSAVGLPPLNLVEMMLISKSRMYAVIQLVAPGSSQ